METRPVGRKTAVPGNDTSSAVRTAATRRAADRAFVVQLAPDCGSAPGGLAGRVQHLATSDGGNFASPEGLIAILRRVLEHLHRNDDELPE